MLNEAEMEAAESFTSRFVFKVCSECGGMSLKGLFKYLSTNVCQSSPGCSYWGEIMQPQLSKEQMNARQVWWIVERDSGLGYSVN